MDQSSRGALCLLTTGARLTMARQTSFRERTLRTTRRRRRLSLELAGLIERELSSELRKYSFSESLTESGERYSHSLVA